MRAALAAKALRCQKAVIEIIANQFNFDCISTKYLGFLNFLLRGGDWHKNSALHAKMAAHICHTLGVVAGAGTNEFFLLGPFAHGVERTAQLIRAHRRKVFALEPDVGVIKRG